MNTSEAARALGKESIKSQKEKLGEKGFIKEQSRRGKLGGRPKKDTKVTPQTK